MQTVSGSFRDPGGRVFEQDKTILRLVTEKAKQEFDLVKKTGLLEDLIKLNRLVDCQESQIQESKETPEILSYQYQFKHPLLPYISYPYEWCFSALKKAALFHLSLQLDALEKSVILCDATAFNIQFQGTQPIFIDHLSFKPYQEGMPWHAHHQFCMQFLHPLLFTAATGLHFGFLLKDNLNGMEEETLLKILPIKYKLSPSIFIHVILPSLLKKRLKNENELQTPFTHSNNSDKTFVSKKNYRDLLKSLYFLIKELELPHKKSLWTEYNTTYCSYDEPEIKTKESTLIHFIKQFSIKTLLDLGCNTGKYACLAYNNGVNDVIGFDKDPLSIEFAFSDAEKKRIPFLPLIADISNPSPGLGWLEKERSGFKDRFTNKVDALIALAIIHHLRFTCGIPLDQLITFIVGLAPNGLIEFVPKEDPMSQRLLQHREDVFADYNRENFEAILGNLTRIKESIKISNTGRRLYLYERK